jgi:hypothetical protein
MGHTYLKNALQDGCIKIKILALLKKHEIAMKKALTEYITKGKG